MTKIHACRPRCVFTPSLPATMAFTHLHGRKPLAAIVKGKDARAMLRLTVSDNLALRSQVAAFPPGTKAAFPPGTKASARRAETWKSSPRKSPFPKRF
jgi:hypothetical protein